MRVRTNILVVDDEEVVRLCFRRTLASDHCTSSSANFLAGELMKSAAGIDVLNVRYKGSGPGALAVASGEVAYTLDTLLTAKSLIDAGRVRAFAVTGDRRTPQMPNVPTFAEAGVPGFDMVAWFGLGGPKGLSPDVVTTINSAVQAALKSPDVRQIIETNAATPMMQTADQFSSFIRNEFGMFEAVVKAKNLKPGS